MEPSALDSAAQASSKAIRSLEARADSLSSWLHVFVFLVVAGVVFEVIVVGFEYWHKRKEYLRGSIRSPEKPDKFWDLLFPLIAATLVAVGVAGELWIDRLAGSVASDLRIENRKLSNLQRERADREIASAKEHAANAVATAKGFEAQIAASNSRAKHAEAQVASAKAASDAAIAKAEGFRFDIARANERAAFASETAERERLARLQLEARLADRTLTPEQQDSLVSALHAFAGTTIDVVEWGDASEVSAISESLEQLLLRSGWTVRSVAALPGQAIVTGILVGTRSGSDPATEHAVARLIEALHAANLSASSWAFEKMPWPKAFMSGKPSIPGTQYDAPIRMFIGSKR
jgi:hypothetical protein